MRDTRGHTGTGSGELRVDIKAGITPPPPSPFEHLTYSHHQYHVILPLTRTLSMRLGMKGCYSDWNKGYAFLGYISNNLLLF